MSNYYKPSGKFSPIALVYFLLACLVLLPLCATIYAYATWYIPFIYINLFITIGLGFAVAIVVGQLVIHLGKVRSFTLAMLLALAGVLVTHYFQWVVWADLAVNAGETYGTKRIGFSVSNIEFDQVWYLLTHPSELFELIKIINENGTWGIRGSVVSGGFLTAIWVIEFLIILFVGLAGSVSRAKEPFSEITQQWLKEEKLTPFSYIEDAESFKRNIETDNWASLAELTPVTDPHHAHSVFTIYGEGNECYLSVENAVLEEVKDGKAKFDQTEIFKYLRISKMIYDQLKAKK